VHSTVTLQTEQRPQPFLAAARRAEFDQCVRDVPTCIPQSVGRSRRDDQNVARAQRAPPEPEPEAKLTRHALEPFPLARVHVSRDEAARFDEQLARHAIARPFAEDDALSADRVVDLVYALVDRSI
jgi:hypothetical protein